MWNIYVYNANSPFTRIKIGKWWQITEGRSVVFDMLSTSRFTCYLHGEHKFNFKSIFNIFWHMIKRFRSIALEIHWKRCPKTCNHQQDELQWTKSPAVIKPLETLNFPYFPQSVLNLFFFHISPSTINLMHTSDWSRCQDGEFAFEHLFSMATQN